MKSKAFNVYNRLDVRENTYNEVYNNTTGYIMRKVNNNVFEVVRQNVRQHVIHINILNKL